MKYFTAISLALFLLLILPQVSEAASAKSTTEPGFREMTNMELLNLTPSGYYERTGHRLSFKEKIGLKVLKLKVRNALKKDPDMDVKTFLQRRKAGDSAGKKIALILLLLLAVVGLIWLEYELSNR
jgi:hypothetical protein